MSREDCELPSWVSEKETLAGSGLILMQICLISLHWLSLMTKVEERRFYDRIFTNIGDKEKGMQTKGRFNDAILAIFGPLFKNHVYVNLLFEQKNLWYFIKTN